MVFGRGKGWGWQSKLPYSTKLQSLNYWEFTGKGILFLSKVASNISRFCHMYKTRTENSCLKGEPFHALSKTWKPQVCKFLMEISAQKKTQQKKHSIFSLRLYFFTKSVLGFSRPSALFPLILISGRDFYCQQRFHLPGLLSLLIEKTPNFFTWV